MELEFLDLKNCLYLLKTLTYEESDLQVIDSALSGLNKKSGAIDYIINHCKEKGCESTLPSEGLQTIFSYDKFDKSSDSFQTCIVGQKKDSQGLPPVVHMNLFSPTLQIPQRVEIPLRYMLKGIPALTGTHCVYQHGLKTNLEETYSYYGITKRGWMKRFSEHMKAAMLKNSERHFPKMLREAIHNRMDQLVSGKSEEELTKNGVMCLTGSYHVLCAAGRTEENACKIETYLINKRSLTQSNGLNMISGRRSK